MKTLCLGVNDTGKDCKRDEPGEFAEGPVIVEESA